MLHFLYPQSWWWWILPTKGEWVEIAHECCWCFPGDSRIWCGRIQHPPLWTHVEVECPGCWSGMSWVCAKHTRATAIPRIGWTEQWQEHYILGMVPSKSSQQTNPMMIAFVEGPTCSKCPSPGGLSRLVPLSSDHPDRSFSSVLKAAEFMMCLGTFWYPRGWTSICQLFWLFLTKGIKGCNDEHEVVSVFNSPRLWCFYLFSIITW